MYNSQRVRTSIFTTVPVSAGRREFRERVFEESRIVRSKCSFLRDTIDRHVGTRHSVEQHPSLTPTVNQSQQEDDRLQSLIHLKVLQVPLRYHTKYIRALEYKIYPLLAESVADLMVSGAPGIP